MLVHMFFHGFKKCFKKVQNLEKKIKIRKVFTFNFLSEHILVPMPTNFGLYI